MRLIFISLVVANLSVAVWGMFLRGDVAKQERPSVVSASKTEASDSASLGIGPRTAGGEGEREGEVTSPLCELVGVFEGSSAAESFVQRLASIDVAASVKRVELPAGVSYWIHLPPEDSREAAFRRLGDMQSQGIESYVIGKGVLANAVSLGVFTVERMADARFEAMKKMGLNVQKTEFERKDIELWVEISPQEAKKMSELTWSAMLEGLSNQERRQNFCLPVAS